MSFRSEQKPWIGAGVFLILAMLLFPPWDVTVYVENGHKFIDQPNSGWGGMYAPLWNPPSPAPQWRSYPHAATLNFPQLVAQSVAIGLAVLLLYWLRTWGSRVWLAASRVLHLRGIALIACAIVAVLVLLAVMEVRHRQEKRSSRIKTIYPLFTQGHFMGHTFFHKGLGLRLSFPAGWEVSTPEAIARINESGRRLLSGGDPIGGAYADEGARARTLFVVHRHPQGSIAGINPSLVGGLENIATRPQIHSGADYLQMLQSFLARGGMPMTFEPIVTDASLVGKNFAVLGVTIESEPGQRIGQVYHARRVEDFVFTVVATFATEAEWQELEAVLQAMTLDR